MELRKSLIVLSLLPTGLTGCACLESSVDRRVTEEKCATSPHELANRGFEAWASSSNLDLNQKSEIWKIHSQTSRDAARIRAEITKTKSALFKELAKGEYDRKLLGGFREKIINLDHERLEIMFKALDSVEKILGRGDEARKYFEYLHRLETIDFSYWVGTADAH